MTVERKSVQSADAGSAGWAAKVRAPRKALAVTMVAGGIASVALAGLGLSHATREHSLRPTPPLAAPVMAGAAANPPAQLSADRFQAHTYATVAGPVDVVMLPVTYEPGESTGWHSHVGLHAVAVTAGRLTIYDSNCEPTTYSPGQPFVGGNDVHLARNETDQPVQMVVTYIVPKGHDIGDFRVPASRPNACPAE